MIETTPDNISMEKAQGKTLSQLKKNGMSGTFFWTGKPTSLTHNGGHLVMQDNKPLNENGYVTEYDPSVKRPVLIYDGKNTIFKRLNNIYEEYSGNIKWAIGGGPTLYPNGLYNPKNDGFTGAQAGVLGTSNHSAIGYGNNGKIYLISALNLSLDNFRISILNSPLGFKYLINLDGGGTTQMYYDKSIIDSSRGLNHFIHVKE